MTIINQIEKILDEYSKLNEIEQLTETAKKLLVFAIEAQKGCELNIRISQRVLRNDNRK